MRTVVLRPPGEVAPPDDILENETDDRPRDVVLSGRRRNETSSIEDDRDAVHCVSIISTT